MNHSNKFTKNLPTLGTGILLLALFCYSPAKAGGLRFGLVGTPTISWMTTDTRLWKQEGVHMGFGYGLVTQFPLSDNYFFGTGVEFSGRGGRLYQESDTLLWGNHIIANIHYKLQYLDIPLNLTMKTNEIGYFTYFGKFGLLPSILVKTRGDVKSTIDGTVLLNEDNANITGVVNPFMLAFQIGLGTEFSISGKTALMLCVSYQRGLTNMMQRPTLLEKQQKIKALGQSVSLTAGILF